MGSGGGGSVGSGSGGGGASLVGDAGGGFGALVDLVGFGARGGVVAVRSGFGGAAVDSSEPPPVPITGGVVVFVRGVALGADRVARDAAGDLRAVVVAGLTVPAGLTSAAGFWAGVAFAIAAARAPVAITEPAATPFVTSDSRRSARSRWWVGGDAIESLSARAWTMPSPP